MNINNDNSVEKFLKEHNIKNKPVIIGYSTGPDSTYLLYKINELKEKYNLEIILAYFNHGWRKEADDEAKYTIELAEKLNLRYFVQKAPKSAKKTEEAARKLRYDFYKKAAEKFKTDVVLLGHNKNDNIETLLYRIIKGTSISGLCSIPIQRDIYFRPLLNTTKEEILDELKEKNISFMIDSSNEDTKYKRNLIRKKIFPILSEINPNFIENIDILIKNSINSKEIIDDVIEKTKKKIMADNEIILNEYLKLKHSIRLEFLNNYLIEQLNEELKNRDNKTILKLDKYIFENKKRTSLTKDKYLAIKNNRIYIEKKPIKNNNELKISKIGSYVFDDIILKVEKAKDIPKTFKKPVNSCYIDIDFPFILRSRKNGDIFQPIGRKRPIKLKEYLIKQKIRQDKKDKLLLITKENEICLILDIETGEKFKAKNNKAIKLSWEKRNG